MNRHWLGRAVAVAFALIIAACAAWTQSAISRLGVSENNAHDIVLSAMSGGYGFYGSASKAFLALSPAARASAVNEVVLWAKAYSNSAAFKKAWAEKRENAKPHAPTVSGTVDDATKASNAEMQKQIDDMKQMAATMPPDQRKAVEDAVKEMSAQMDAAMKDPSRQALQRQSVEAQRTNDQNRYQSDLKKWNEDFPADPNLIIARRLREFLTMSADVNFDAKLQTQEGRKTFVDKQYEQEPEDWKICFRAGREATTAARAAATAWLKEIEH